jgi:hypothetical protein
MLRRIANFLGVDADGINKKQDDTSSLDNKAKVYIWSGDRDNVGHVSMQFQPKNNPTPTYLSIWPDRFPAVGPLAYVPLHATLAKRLADDMKAESSGFSIDFRNGGEDLVPNHKKEIEPDKIFSVPITQMDALREEFERIDEGIKEGKIRYQLFANSKTTNTEVYDCATLVDHLLKTGGVDSLPEKAEWKPSSFSEILAHQPNVTLLKM